jgi:hypothetical protein
VFDAVRAAYVFQLPGLEEDVFACVLSLRHPNVSSSLVVSTFRLEVVPDPNAAALAEATAADAAAATAAAASATGGSTANTSSSAVAAAAAAAATGGVLTAADLALFNPLVNPRIVFVAALPSLMISGYPGGSAKALSDFKAVVVAGAALDGPAWVEAVPLNGTRFTVNATVCSRCGVA